MHAPYACRIGGKMQRFVTASAAFAAIALAVIALGAIFGAPTHVEAADPIAVACTGVAASDAREPACGVALPRTPHIFTWRYEPVPIAAALATPRLAFRGTPGGVPAAGGAARALDHITVWQRDAASGGWRSWSSRPEGPFATLQTFERGGVYFIVTTADLDLSLAPLRPSVFAGARIVSLYGYPGVPEMGALGEYASAGAAAEAAERLAQQYRPLSGGTRVVAALHLIVSMAQADAGYDGSYLGRISLAAIRPYVEATRARGQLLFLDVQVGWSDPLAEVRLLEPLLREPHVHLALDPEFATRGKDEAPGEAIGYLTPGQVNEVQHYLAGLAAREAIPPKVLVLHQFRYDMLHDPERIERVDGVDVVIDMDGWGTQEQKLDGYQLFARAPYAEYAGFKLFYHWDQPLLTPAQVMALSHPPDYLIYQ